MSDFIMNSFSYLLFFFFFWGVGNFVYVVGFFIGCLAKKIVKKLGEFKCQNRNQ